MLVFGAGERFAFTLSLVVDIPLVGTIAETHRQVLLSNRVDPDRSRDLSALNVGLQLGVQGRF